MLTWNAMTAIALMTCLPLAYASSPNFLCTHEKGAVLFKNNEVVIERSGKSIVVRPYVGVGRKAVDDWTYEVLIENEELKAVRAVRLLPGKRNTGMNALSAANSSCTVMAATCE